MLKCYNNSSIIKLNVITIKWEAIMEIKDAKVFHDYLNGVIEGKDVKKSTKLYASAKTFYKSVDSSVSDDQIMYEVYSYGAPVRCS